MEKTSWGTDEQITATMCYLLGWVSGLLFIFLEPRNKTVRFHAWQSLLVFLPLQLLIGVFMIIPFVGWFFLFPQMALGYIALWLFLLVNTYQGKKVALPFFGQIAEKYSTARGA